MRYLTAIILALCATFAIAIDNEDRCQKKSYDVWKTVHTFCGKPQGDITVPSEYASTGAAKLDKGIVVMISGKCSPPQWVPRHYCLSQFWKVCATGGPKGAGQIKFGKDKCQNWLINTAP